MANRPRRSRRSRDVPHELHKRIETLERRDLNVRSNSGREVKRVGFVVPLSPGEGGLAGWGWAGQVDAENIIQQVIEGWGWGDGAAAVNINTPFSEGWGWADQATGTAITTPVVDAGWGWADIESATNISTPPIQAGWGWAGDVRGSLRSAMISADDDDLSAGDATIVSGAEANSFEINEREVN